MNEMSAQDLLGVAGLDARDRLEGGQRDLVGARVGEGDVVELEPGRRPGQHHRVGSLLDHRGQVEHLEDPLEADQGGHHVDADVGEPLQRPEQSQQQGAEREQGPHGQGALDRQVTAHAVDERGRERRNQQHRRGEDAGDQGDPDAEVAHRRRLVGEHRVLLAAAAEQLEQHGAADVEPLGHGVAHVGVAVHLLPGQPGQPAAHHPRDQQQEREQGEAEQGDLPAQGEHGDADDEHGDRCWRRRSTGSR